MICVLTHLCLCLCIPLPLVAGMAKFPQLPLGLSYSWHCIWSYLLHSVWVTPAPFPDHSRVLQKSHCESGLLGFLHPACMETLLSEARGRQLVGGGSSPDSGFSL